MLDPDAELLCLFCQHVDLVLHQFCSKPKGDPNIRLGPPKKKSCELIILDKGVFFLLSYRSAPPATRMKKKKRHRDSLGFSTDKIAFA